MKKYTGTLPLLLAAPVILGLILAGCGESPPAFSEARRPTPAETTAPSAITTGVPGTKITIAPGREGPSSPAANRSSPIPAAAAAVGSGPLPPRLKACQLLPQADVEEILLAKSVAEGYSKFQELGDTVKDMCSWNLVRLVGVEKTRANILLEVELVQRNTSDPLKWKAALDIWRENGKQAPTFHPVSGVGDEAFGYKASKSENYYLFALKGETFFQLSLRKGQTGPELDLSNGFDLDQALAQKLISRLP